MPVLEENGIYFLQNHGLQPGEGQGGKFPYTELNITLSACFRYHCENKIFI